MMTNTINGVSLPLLDLKPIKVVNLNGGGLNQVFQINDQYLVKRFGVLSQLQQEATGLYLSGLLGNTNSPLLISQGEDFLVAEFVTEAQTAFVALQSNDISLAQVNLIIAKFVAQTYWRFQLFDQKKLRFFPVLSWRQRLQQLPSSLTRHRAALLDCLSPSEITNIACALQKIVTDESLNPGQTLVHRDLHLDNLLVSKIDGFADFKIIDYEHAMLGPVELELQNSLFWHDEKSLAVDEIRQILVAEYCVPYSIEREKRLRLVYFADQLNLAAIRNDRRKLACLVKQYKNHLGRIESY